MWCMCVPLVYGVSCVVCRVSCVIVCRSKSCMVRGTWYAMCYCYASVITPPLVAAPAAVKWGAEEIGVLGAKLRENFKDHAL